MSVSEVANRRTTANSNSAMPAAISVLDEDPDVLLNEWLGELDNLIGVSSSLSIFFDINAAKHLPQKPYSTHTHVWSRFDYGSLRTKACIRCTVCSDKDSSAIIQVRATI